MCKEYPDNYPIKACGEIDQLQERIEELEEKLYGGKSGVYDSYVSRLLGAAKNVFNWFYIFGEDSDAAREHLAELGNAIKNYESHEA